MANKYLLTYLGKVMQMIKFKHELGRPNRRCYIAENDTVLQRIYIARYIFQTGAEQGYTKRRQS